LNSVICLGEARRSSKRKHLSEDWRVERDARRTCQPVEIAILVKMYRKRSMGALISLGEPLDHSLPYKRGILSKHRLNAIKKPEFIASDC